ncbi:transport and Golgi organization protein 11 isoform X2 [Culicoides brevitarsis]|uniref:transport and Golgi organization protein 11 isoform X2 n=1 Tax=Culicoides brevitarsis TaxID=469753 RepID=UPI00307B8585
MSGTLSPGVYGYEDDPIVQSSVYTHDISERMRVPKRIKATGDFYDENELLSNGNGMPAWNYQNKIDMNVPDRIVVLGQDQHLGTKSAPREIMFENTVLPKDPGFIRVATPPRNITLSEHRFPAADDPVQFDVENDIDEYEQRSVDSLESVGRRGGYGTPIRSKKYSSELRINHRDGTPPLNSSIENLTPSEEVLHLRRQVAKLNRRVLTIELDNINRQQREKVLYAVGMAYFLMKAFMWLNRK